MSDRVNQTKQLSPIKRLERDASRVREIVGVLVRYGFADWLAAVHIQAFVDPTAEPQEGIAKQSKEERIRLALIELGPTFIKVGQLLSTRPDLINPALAQELSKLLEDVPPDPPEVVATTLAQELGSPVNVLFAEFDPQPYASASIAQVHRALLGCGCEVAVKVQKRGIQAQVEADLSIMESAGQIAEEHSDAMKALGVAQMVEEFKRTILNDLDFNRELRNIETFRANFENDPTVRFPATWPEYSARRVLTMEFLAGISGSNVQEVQEAAGDVDAFAERGANVYLNMIFRDSFYHADPHPGNLMLLPGGVVGVVDCGTVGRIDEGLREDLESLVEAITRNDIESLTHTLWNLSPEESDEEEQRLHSDLSALLEDADVTSENANVSAVLIGMLRIFHKYRLSVRHGLTALLRTIIELDGTARSLSPSFNLQSVLQPYESKIVARKLDPTRWFEKSRKNAREWVEFLEDLPSDLSKTLHKVRTGELRVRLEHRNLNSIVNRVVLGLIIAALILGSSLLWSFKAPPLFDGVSLLGIVGYAAVLILGWLLYRAIKDSGEISPQDD